MNVYLLNLFMNVYLFIIIYHSLESKVINPPQAKKICSSDEIAEKKRQALQRREAYLESLRLTQKKPNVKL